MAQKPVELTSHSTGSIHQSIIELAKFLIVFELRGKIDFF
ncbi:hypothetical protein RV11_GL002754 [Enterococcus phoeniculicola]|nr:hypothetical protein RV11_GL002754 [Enterococcus phoeniculicola]